MWPKKNKPFLAELKKDCFYIIMMPADQRDEFIKALEALDLSEGPEILVLDEMHLTVAEFTKADRRTRIVHAGAKN
jgi:hypothetical protein